MRLPATASVIALVVWMCSAKAQAYRTGHDQTSTSDTDRVRWSNPAIHFQVSASGAPGVAYAYAEEAVQAAATRWSSLACSSAQLVIDGAGTNAASGDGTNTIEWNRDAWEDLGFPSGSAGTTDLLYQRSASGDWEIVEADVHLNGYDFTWTTTAAATDAVRSIEAVATHELGHVLGLLHPCEVDGRDGAPLCSSDTSFASRTMYPSYLGPAQAVLSPDDIAGVCFLYPLDGCTASCGPGEACVAGGCRPTCAGELCDPGESCVGGSLCLPDCEGLACLSAGSCAVASDCDAAHACVGGQCLPRLGAMGDPCESHADCLSGACRTGQCVTPCTMTCDAGFSCVADDSGSVCVSSMGGLGEPCATGSECQSGRCLDPSRHPAVCSRLCGAGQLPCPTGFACLPIDGEYLCSPPLDPGGCSAAAGPTPDLLVLLICVLALSMCRARFVPGASR